MQKTVLKRDLVIPAGTVLKDEDDSLHHYFIGLFDLAGARKGTLLISRGAMDANPDLFGEKTAWEELRDGKEETLLDRADPDSEVLGIGA